LLVGLLGVLVLGGWLVGSAVEAVTGAGDRTRLDGPVTRAIVEQRSDGLTTLFRAVTILGDRPALVPLVLVVGTILGIRRRSWAPLAFLAIAQLGSIVLYNAVKALVARPRPAIGPVVASATGFGFPSAHATQAAAVWGALAVLAGRSLADRRSRGAVAGAAAALVALIGVSRLYLGIHWATDVVGGWALGALWLVAIVKVPPTAQGASPPADQP
jgi:undecaprenyl-diphosphatase